MPNSSCRIVRHFAYVLKAAGRSPFKGTAALARVWRRHPEWPTLTLMHAENILEPLNVPNIEQRIGYVDDDVLRQLQNESWLHVLPTEAERLAQAVEQIACIGFWQLLRLRAERDERRRPS